LPKVAIVGGGVAGIGAAIALTKTGIDVSLFEAEARLGGHCFGVAVPLWDGRTVRVDGGVADFNPVISGAFCDLLQELDLRCHATSQDISFMLPDRSTVWSTRGGEPHFRRPPNDPKALVEEIDRFNRTSVELLEDATYADWSAQRYLDDKRYSDEFRSLYFDPRARGEFSFPVGPPSQLPIRRVVSAWHMLGVVGAEPCRRMSVQGGMHTYCEAAARWLRQRNVPLFLSTRVVSITRPEGSVCIRTIDREKASSTFSFDHVVLATDATQALALLADAVRDEAGVFSEIASRRARVVVHQDLQMLPADRATWGAYNYLLEHDRDGDPSRTVYVNRLQNLPASVPDVFVTINPVARVDPEKVITDQWVIHPVIGGISDAVGQKLDAMQGKRRTWFCGGYLREPFIHEQAYRSGLEVADRLVKAVADESLKFEAGLVVSPGGFDDFLR
jgi:predicted NAD/FAD-binding protein